MKHQKTIEQDVIKYIKRHNLLLDAKKIIVALSGGADSVFALHFFYKYKNKYKIEILAVHVNHNLRRSESYKDEKFCNNLCKNFSIPFYSSSVDVKTFAKENKFSVEEAARVLRYNELEKFAVKTKSDLIVTAHNNDDNTETVLLNIASGTGLDGIAGIPIKRDNIIRPFLCVSKNDIKLYLKELNLKYREDSSNKNLELRRNYLRKKIIPLIKKNVNPSLNKVILNSSEVIRNQKEIIEYFISKVIEESVKSNSRSTSINILKLKKYPKTVWGEVFKNAIQNYTDTEFSFQLSLKLNELIDCQTGSLIEISKNYVCIKERNQLILKKSDENIFSEIKIKIGQTIQMNNKKFSIEKFDIKDVSFNKKKFEEIISLPKLKSDFVLREWQDGEFIQPLGMKGKKKISDILTDSKVPNYKRKRQLVLTCGKDIVWLVGLIVSEKYKVTSKTKSILKLCLN
ncbi:MAG: tRNA lysidine(34) synthetase TilS [Ignavibacteriae bacterium]|nr:tRNA lysidine(34) synthetase TilS [Ignavibacteriota bacterium]